MLKSLEDYRIASAPLEFQKRLSSPLPELELQQKNSRING